MSETSLKCGKCSDDTKRTEASLQGKWKVLEIKMYLEKNIYNALTSHTAVAKTKKFGRITLRR